MRTTTLAAPAPATTGLAPYTGPWTKAEAAHLLRRTLMGPKRQEIIDAAAAGLSATLDILLAPPTLPDPPVNHYFPDDTNVPIGATWIDSPHLDGVDVGQYRGGSLRGWYMNQLIESPYHIMDRLAMFWVNHFGMSDVGEHRAQYQYLTLFRDIGLGSFKTMIERITTHPSMLHFLDGAWSHKWSPNENYGRELLELFSIQKGPLVAPGDYTNYTEDDVRVIARCMTGWRTRGMWSTDNVPVESYWWEDWHDDETDPWNPNQNIKQLSHRFNNAIIPNNDENEYKDVINIIFDQGETPKAICRELYRFFVHYDLTPQVETDIITPLAQHMIGNNYNIGSTLRLLFSSQHFYDMSVRGTQIKNPYEFMMSMSRTMGGYEHLGLSLTHNGDDMNSLWTIYNIGRSYHWRVSQLGMDVWYPPTVAGWKAYYQSPTFYRNWIGSSTLQERRRLVETFTWSGIWTQTDDGDYNPRPFDWMGFIDALTNPWDSNDITQETIEIFLPRDVHPDQFDALKAILNAYVSDNEWTVQYGQYFSSPQDPMIRNSIENRVKEYFRALFSMAEFHLI